MIIIKVGSEAESFAAALVPIFSVSGFCVKYDATTDGAKWGGTKVKRAIEILPRRDAGVGVCLMQEV